MGYDSAHTLTVANVQMGRRDDEIDIPTIIKEIREEFEDAAFAINPKGGTGEICHWYEYERDLREFSKKHPGILFTLHRVGSSPGDLANSYFLDGKMQQETATITIPPFDPKKLK